MLNKVYQASLLTLCILPNHNKLRPRGFKRLCEVFTAGKTELGLKIGRADFRVSTL